MASERRLRMKTLVMVLAMVVCANAGDLLLKQGMSRSGAVQLPASGLAQAFRLTVTNGTIWVGILFLTGFMLSYMTVLRWADYSYVIPAGAFGYALLPLLAGAFFHFAGLTRRGSDRCLVLLGRLRVGATKPRTDPQVRGSAAICAAC